ncbi:MAG: adenylyl-sulfate kinase, partial [Gammaproteobacteria bacterium]|nr:adenylyl-sulfate kinase [Gammaproteobacteria bacterium]
LQKSLLGIGRTVLFLDGDQLREDLEQYGYSYSERLKLSFSYGRLCKRFSSQGLDVICTTVSLFEEIQIWNRKNIPNYIEIFVDVPFEVLKERDSKSVYSNAKMNNFPNTVGIDIPPHFPKNPDCVIKNYGNQSVSDSIQEVILFVQKMYLIKNKDMYVSS